MSRQQMTFQLAYGSSLDNTKCKSCQGPADPDQLLVGVKSESMYDPMWYHDRCFWTRCWYRKHMSRHVQDYTQLAGYSTLTSQDQERFKAALDDLTGEEQPRLTHLKRRSVSDENVTNDVNSKKSKNDVTILPKLSLSATELLAKPSSPNGAAPKNSPESCPDQEVIPISKTLLVTVSRAPGGASMTFSAPCLDSEGRMQYDVNLNHRQWESMTSLFDDITDVVTTLTEIGKRDIPLLDSHTIRIARDNTGVSIALTRATENRISDSAGQLKHATFTPDEWRDLTARAGEIDAAFLRMSA